MTKEFELDVNEAGAFHVIDSGKCYNFVMALRNDGIELSQQLEALTPGDRVFIVFCKDKTVCKECGKPFEVK